MADYGRMSSAMNTYTALVTYFFGTVQICKDRLIELCGKNFPFHIALKFRWSHHRWLSMHRCTQLQLSSQNNNNSENVMLLLALGTELLISPLYIYDDIEQHYHSKDTNM